VKRRRREEEAGRHAGRQAGRREYTTKNKNPVGNKCIK